MATKRFADNPEIQIDGTEVIPVQSGNGDFRTTAAAIAALNQPALDAVNETVGGLAENVAALAQSLSDSNALAAALQNEIGALQARVSALENGEPIPEPDPLPVLTLASSASSVEEGSTITFTVTGDRIAPVGGLTVGIAYGGTLPGAMFEGPDAVTVGAGQTSATFQVALVDDSTPGDSHTLSAALQSGSGYTLGSPITQTVTVTDSDVVTPPPVEQPLRFATQANAINKNRANRSRTDVQCRWACRIGSRAKQKIAVAWMAWSAPIALGNDLPIYMALVEYNGVTVPLTWGGSRSVTITNNTNGPISDELDASAFGVTEFPRGATIYVKSWVKFATTTQFIPYSARETASGGQVWWFNAADTVMSDFDAPGAIVKLSGVNQDARTQGMQPMVLGRDVAGAPGTGDAWFFQGSSSTEGVGDASTFLNYGGWAGRSMVTDQAMGADPVSYCNFAVAASTTDLAYGKPLTNYWMQFANKGIISYGSNNLNTGGTGSLSSMQAQLTSAINNMRDNGGIQHILTTNLQPRVDSTDNWATLANQVAAAGWDVGGTVQQYNSWQAGLVGTLTQGHILHNGIRAGTNPDLYTYYRWWTNGTANWPTTDGTHPSAVSHEAMAAGSRPFVYGTA